MQEECVDAHSQVQGPFQQGAQAVRVVSQTAGQSLQTRGLHQENKRRHIVRGQEGEQAGYAREGTFHHRGVALVHPSLLDQDASQKLCKKIPDDGADTTAHAQDSSVRGGQHVLWRRV